MYNEFLLPIPVNKHLKEYIGMLISLYNIDGIKY